MGLDPKCSNGGSSTRINITEEFNKTNIWRQVNEKKTADDKHTAKSAHNDIKKTTTTTTTLTENQRNESYQQHILKNTQP